MIYLIAGPGRTGSTWLSEIIKDQLGVTRVYHLPSEEPNLLTVALSNIISVVHTHDNSFVRTYEISPENVSFIISKRRDSFAWILSHCIAHHTKEYGNYSNKKSDPIEMDLHKFIREYNHRESWYKSINLDIPYSNVAVVYYEDMVASTSYKSLLQDVLPYTIEFSNNYSYGKSPYNYREWISNWEELYTWYKGQSDS